MKNAFMKKLFATLIVTAGIIVATQVCALACTTLYVGGNLTQDGAPIVARSEDYINSEAKLAYISPAGAYKGGTLYTGCDEYGAFEWTWSHDSYAFWAFKADNVFDGLCPECGLPGHPSYTEHGTNECGVTVSATESTNSNDAVAVQWPDDPTADNLGVDPYVMTKAPGTIDGKPVNIVGIEETDIPTIILGEAKTAREGVDLLLYIYDNYGCYEPNGLFIADQNETWYIENCSGHQYVAIKCNDSMMFLEPNMTIIGRINLNDKDNVIASPGIMDVAQKAGTFVGDAAKNIIDWRASYDTNIVGSKNRLSNGLNFINKNYNYTDDALLADNSAFTISNVDKNDKVIPLYTNIQADRKIGPDDIANYYKVPGIANIGNTDTAFFQLYKDGRAFQLSTVAWIQMNHGAYNVFVPFYPLLTNSLYEGYGHAVGQATKDLTEADLTDLLAGDTPPTMYYRTATTGDNSTFTVLPQNWEQNYYWTFDALSNYILYAQNNPAGAAVSADNLQYVLDQFAYLQKSIYGEFDSLNAQLAKMSVTSAAAKDAATVNFADMAQQAHALALELVKYLSASASYQLTYVGAGTSVGPVKHYAAGYTATIASAQAGSFLGWDTDPQATTVVYKAGDTFAINNDTTLYAVKQGSVVATKSNNTLILDGKKTVFPAIKVDGYNWLKLRDFAALLNGTEKQFSIRYEAATGVIYITTGEAYAPLGNELQDTLQDTENATASPQSIYFNGEKIDAAAFNVNGYNYFRLRDLASLLDFALIYDDATGQITLDFSNPYSE